MKDDRKIASSANKTIYNTVVCDNTETFPHLRHKSLVKLYQFLVNQAYHHYKNLNKIKVLDIGCGEGIATSLFLKLGCHVTAVDI